MIILIRLFFLIAIQLFTAQLFAAQPLGQKQSLHQYLGDGTSSDSYLQVDKPRPLIFPTDHGPHPGFRHEWWYFSGNLESSEHNQFGYQLTFFRFALTPKPLSRDSKWASDSIFMAHLALTNVGQNSFNHEERFSRPALGLAGAQAEPFCVWLNDWQVQMVGGTAQKPIWAIAAQTESFGLQLTLQSEKPIVLQGEEGYSRKNSGPGNASLYYSLPRLKTTGEITQNGKKERVNGTSWLDREWGSGVLDSGQAGWDWFAIHLDDGWDFMFYQLRKKDGTIDQFSRGVLIDPRGVKTDISATDIKIKTTASWSNYPAGWQLTIPAHNLMMTVTPLVADQEWKTSRVQYWEGAVKTAGQHGSKKITGRGYVELTGYGPQEIK